MARRRPTWVLCSLLLVGCESSLDVNQPIGLLVEEKWDAYQTDTVAQAAHSWNAVFGTQLYPEVEPSAARQTVRISESELVCGYANGLTLRYPAIEVQICPLDAKDLTHLYRVILHELGHVLNIRGHAVDPLAVMHGQGVASACEIGLDPCFLEEDAQMFYAANPDFDEMLAEQRLAEAEEELGRPE